MRHSSYTPSRFEPYCTSHNSEHIFVLFCTINFEFGIYRRTKLYRKQIWGASETEPPEDKVKEFKYAITLMTWLPVCTSSVPHPKTSLDRSSGDCRDGAPLLDRNKIFSQCHNFGSVLRSLVGYSLLSYFEYKSLPAGVMKSPKSKWKVWSTSSIKEKLLQFLCSFNWERKKRI